MIKDNPDHLDNTDDFEDSDTDFEETGRKTKISEYSERYVKERIRKVLAKETKIFGQDLVDHLEMEQFLGEERNTKKRLLKKIRTQLKYAIRKTPYQRDESSHFYGIYHFMSQIRFYPSLKKKLAEKRPDQDKITLKDLVEFYSNDIDEIPDDILEKMVSHHNEEVKHRAKESEKTLQDYTEKCKQQIKNTARKLNLPISEDQIEKRFKEVSISFIDSIIAELEEIGGKFDHRNASINLAYHLIYTNLYKVLVHEILHALSGQTIIGEDEEPEEYSEEFDEFESARIGLAIYNRFRWLNESITEKLTEMCLKDNQEEYSPSYKQEKALFELLKTSGSKEISERLFLEAYFENYDTAARDNGKTTIPKWRELTKAINEAYEPGFLVKLDKYIQKNGTKKALEVMQKDWRAISS